MYEINNFTSLFDQCVCGRVIVCVIKPRIKIKMRTQLRKWFWGKVVDGVVGFENDSLMKFSPWKCFFGKKKTLLFPIGSAIIKTSRNLATIPKKNLFSRVNCSDKRTNVDNFLKLRNFFFDCDFAKVLIFLFVGNTLKYTATNTNKAPDHTHHHTEEETRFD